MGRTMLFNSQFVMSLPTLFLALTFNNKKQLLEVDYKGVEMF